MKQQKLFSEHRINMEEELAKLNYEGWTVVSIAGEGGVIVFLAEKDVEDPAEPDDPLWGVNFRDLDPVTKVTILHAMGFSRSGSDHTDTCPYAIDEGYVCNCVPPQDVFVMPDDVAKHLGQDWESRRKAAEKPRPIPDVER